MEQASKDGKKEEEIKKVKVVFDTNKAIIWDGARKEIFHEDLIKLAKFVKDNNLESRVKICIPETVYEEIVKETTSKVYKEYKDAAALNKTLGDIAPAAIVSSVKESDLRKMILDRVDLKISEYNLSSIPVATRVTLDELYNRSKTHTPPFGAEDKGFKDTMIWFSVLEDAEKNNDFEYVFISGDRAFLNDSTLREFQNITKREIQIFQDAKGVEELLDEMLGLGLEMEKTRNEVVAKIEKDTQLQIDFVNRAMKDIGGYDSGIIIEDWKTKVSSLTYKDTQVRVSGNKGREIFEVEAMVSFLPRYGLIESKSNKNEIDWINDLERRHDPTYVSLSFYREYRPKIVAKKFLLEFNAKSKSLIIKDSEEVRDNLWGF